MTIEVDCSSPAKKFLNPATMPLNAVCIKSVTSDTAATFAPGTILGMMTAYVPVASKNRNTIDKTIEATRGIEREAKGFERVETIAVGEAVGWV